MVNADGPGVRNHATVSRIGDSVPLSIYITSSLAGMQIQSIPHRGRGGFEMNTPLKGLMRLLQKSSRPPAAMRRLVTAPYSGWFPLLLRRRSTLSASPNRSTGQGLVLPGAHVGHTATCDYGQRDS